MLCRLDIKNYAIIEALSVEFHEGFNIITGETGAGKSILMGALGLVLGDRADTSVLFDEQQKCIVEALFVPHQPQVLHRLLEQNDMDTDNQLVVRREISASGKSRSFVNDTPVTLQVLRQFASQMVDLHRQFDTLDLGSDAFQRNVIDGLCGAGPTLAQYQQHYQAYTTASAQLNALLERQSQAGKELDFRQFLFGELQAAQLAENELEEAEAELQLLDNAESIKQSLGMAIAALDEGETPVVAQLKWVLQQLQQLKAQPAGLSELCDRLQSAYVEIRDISDEINSLSDKIILSAERQQQLTERLDMGYRLLKKHGLTTTAQLLHLQNTLALELQQVLHLGDEIEKWQQKAQQSLSETLKVGEKLSGSRQKAIPQFQQNMKRLLAQVGMPNAALQVQCTKLAKPGPYGIDAIQFLFDANQSGRFEPLEKVASGGELSRLMLSIKSLVAGSMQMPTLIFDEIDTGISGEAARQVGIIMRGLSAKHQLIAITHQPQIAARAQAHFFVFKANKEGATKTGIKLLGPEDRVQAIATMLSGNEITDASRNIALQMLQEA